MDNNAALTWKWCQFSVWQITHTLLLKLPGGTIWNVLACSKASALLDSHPDTFHCYLSQWAWMVALFSLAALLLTGWQMWLQHGVGKPLSSLTVYTWDFLFWMWFGISWQFHHWWNNGTTSHESHQQTHCSTASPEVSYKMKFATCAFTLAHI